MRKIFLNTVKIWNAQWSHGHQLATALASTNFIYYFEQMRAIDNPYSGLMKKNNYQVPDNMKIIGTEKVFKKISFTYLIYNQWQSLRTLWRLRKEVDFYFSYNVYDLAGLILARLLRLPTVFLFIDEYDLLTRWPKLQPLLRFLLINQLWLAGKVVVTAKKLEERAKKYNSNVFYLPNAVGVGDFNLARDCFGLRSCNGRLIVGFIGSLGNWVDGDLILNAAKHYPRVNFEIYGDGVVYERLLREARNGRGISNLHLFGRISHSDFYKRASHFDAAIIPFVRNEITDSVSPIKLFEYWLMKLPVIARKTAELEQFSKGLLLYESIGEFFAYIDKLLENRHIYDRLGESGYELVQKKYNWRCYADFFNEHILRK